MQRYTVNFRAPNVATRRLLVPFLSSLSVRAFATELQQRLSRVGVVAEAGAIAFHLDDASGPSIDADDSLQNVILDPRNEQIFASIPTSALRGESNSTESGREAASSAMPDFLVSVRKP